MSLPEPHPLPAAQAEILLVDDDPKTLLAMEAMLADVGGTVVTARSGREALLRLLTQDFAVILLDVQMPDLDGFETAELIRERDKSRHTPIIFLTAFNQNDRAMLRGYALGAVDFMFKPIVPEILRSKVQVFVDLRRKTRELERQALLLRDGEAREHARRLAEERQRWEADNLRAQMERERAAAAEMARKAEELARAVADRDAAARALVQSNARLALLSDTANRLLTGTRPHELLDELFERLTAHLDLDLYAYRALEDDAASLTLRASGGIDRERAEPWRVVRIGQGMAGVVAETRQRMIVDAHTAPSEIADTVEAFGASACVCFPLVADERLIGTLTFGSRRRGRFTLEELAVLQLVADQISIVLERERLVDELRPQRRRARRRRSAQGRVPGHAGARAAQPAGADLNAMHVLELDAQGRRGSFARSTRPSSGRSRHLAGSSTTCSTSRASRAARSSSGADKSICARPSAGASRPAAPCSTARGQELVSGLPESRPGERRRGAHDAGVRQPGRQRRQVHQAAAPDHLRSPSAATTGAVRAGRARPRHRHRAEMHAARVRAVHAGRHSLIGPRRLGIGLTLVKRLVRCTAAR